MLTQKSKGKKYSKQQLKEFIIDVKQKIGHPPTVKQYNSYYTNIRAIDRLFGGFNNAVAIIFGQQHRHVVNKSFICTCKNCGKDVIKKVSQIKKNKSGNIFCGRSCASKYNGIIKIKQSQQIKQRIKNGTISQSQLSTTNYTKIICRQCNQIFYSKDKTRITCSSLCLKGRRKNNYKLFNLAPQQIQKRNNGAHLGGLSSSQKQLRRSSDQIKLFELCAKKWTNVTSNQIITQGWDADILLKDYKIAILWNGPWHYKQLNFKNHSLKQVQKRDQIKTSKLQQKGWIVLKFRDDQYKPMSAFNQIQKLIQSLDISEYFI